MSIPRITEAIIRRYASAESLQQGERQYHSGAVVALTQWGNYLYAKVQETATDSYHVVLRWEDEQFVAIPHCTCSEAKNSEAKNLEAKNREAKDSGAKERWCQHVIATLLVCAHQPQKIEERPPLEQLLDRLSLTQTQRLVQELVAENPVLLTTVDRLIQTLSLPSASTIPLAAVDLDPAQRQTAVDAAPFRHQVQQILQDAAYQLESGWLEEDPVTDPILDLIQQAEELSALGDSRDALIILEAIADTCSSNWGDLEDYGIYFDLISEELDTAFTEAILNTELTPTERVVLQTNLQNWQDELDSDFSMSLEALRQGWDYPVLQEILQGKTPDLGAWEGIPPNFANELTQIRLHVLERQERYSEYLYLAEAEGQTQLYLTMLGRLGQIEQAMEMAESQMHSSETAFALAQTLHQQGATQQAIEIACLGLTLQGHSLYPLAIWTSELAEEVGDRTTALNTRLRAFQANPTFADYCKIETLVSDTEASVKEDLLKFLRESELNHNHRVKIDIFLYEGLIEDAIATVSPLLAYPGQEELVQRVMAAASSRYPDWVIQTAHQYAKSIIEAGKTTEYGVAVHWLKQARDAYYQAGRSSEWVTYHNQLMQEHARKYKLVSLLRQQELE